MHETVPTSIRANGPLVTLVLYAFNEERFIREAVESAFAQTYSPLEVVLSDDGSSDRTFQIMEEMAAAYRGPHTIILNRNEMNIGIGSQINAAFRKGSGALIVLANGDDVSLPERVARTVDTWRATEKSAFAITCDLATMDEHGCLLARVIRPEPSFSNLEQAVSSRCGPVAAASLAVSRAVFERFGDLAPSLILEDGPIYLRAAILGSRSHVPEALVRYRIHRENISQAYAIEELEAWAPRHRKRLAWQNREAVKAYLQMMNDLHSGAIDRLDHDDLERARWAAIEKMAENQILAGYYSRDAAVCLRSRLSSICRLALLVIKLVIKSMLPFLERRNDRWHYRKVVESEWN